MIRPAGSARWEALAEIGWLRPEVGRTAPFGDTVKWPGPLFPRYSGAARFRRHFNDEVLVSRTGPPLRVLGALRPPCEGCCRSRRW